MALEQAEGAHSPAVAQALGSTVRYIESYREKVVERASYCAMVAEQAREMEAAHLAANDAIDETFRLLNAAFIALGAVGGHAGPAQAHMADIERSIRNARGRWRGPGARFPMRHASHGDWQRRERAEIDVALDKLYRMQGDEFLRDAGDFLKGLFKAA